MTLFRFFLALPALLIAGGYGGVLFTIAILGWFAALFTGHMPEGLRNLGAAAVRYSSQTYAYLYLSPTATPTRRRSCAATNNPSSLRLPGARSARGTA